MYQAINVKISTPGDSLNYLYKDVINLVNSEQFPNVLEEILKLPLNSPFPTKGISKIEKNYAVKLEKESSFSADLNCYWSSIAGVISRIIKGRIGGSLQETSEILQTSFFESHEAYSSFKEASKEFDDIYNEFIVFEKAKMLGLIYISLIKCKSSI